VTALSVRYRTLRRRLSETAAAHDWLEIVFTIVGLGFLTIAAICVWGIVTAISTWGEADPGFRTTVGFLQVTRGFAIVLFSVLGLLAFGVGWFLAGERLRRAARLLRRR
jgi:hypothetical protein